MCIKRDGFVVTFHEGKIRCKSNILAQCTCFLSRHTPVKKAADQALGGSVLEADGMEGLSAEDFASAQEALMVNKKLLNEFSFKLFE